MNTDLVRTGALGTACAGFVTIPNLGALLGKGEQVKRYDTVLTPPDYAFAVWAPIFAGCVANIVGQCRPSGRSLSLSRRTGWPLAGAYATNALWSLAAQTDRFALTPVLLPIATSCVAIAYVRLQPATDVTGWSRVIPISTGLLLGWTALASTVNLAAGALLLGVRKSSPRTVATSTVGLLAISAAGAGTVAASRHGSTPLAITLSWGLGTIAATSGKPLAVRVAAAAGGVAVAAAATRRETTNRRKRVNAAARAR